MGETLGYFFRNTGARQLANTGRKCRNKDFCTKALNRKGREDHAKFAKTALACCVV